MHYVSLSKYIYETGTTLPLDHLLMIGDRL